MKGEIKMLYRAHLTLEEEVTEERWQKAFEVFRQQITEAPDRSGYFDDYFDFSHLVTGVLFLFEQVGVREIRNLIYFAGAFQTLWRRQRSNEIRKEFYPDELFREAYDFNDRRAGNRGKILFEEVLMLRLTRRNDMALYLGDSDYIARVDWQYFLMLARSTFSRLKKEKNQKYIPHIFEVAKDLFKFLSHQEP